MPAAMDGDVDAEMTSAPTPSLDLPSQLKWYYSRLFPAALFGRWLGYGSDEYLSRREISFTLPGDIYLRWRSYGSMDLLLSSLKSQTPIKMDIGAVYNFPPKDRTTVTAALTPQAKELVFDIDLTDYDEVIDDPATLNDPTARCDAHWPYMATAVKVLDAALRDDFGFERILWVYSGRRGIHGWVCDARARAMNNAQRAAVADFLTIRVAGRGAQRGLSTPLHPSLRRARRLCEPAFVEHVLGAQDVLGPQRARSTLADLSEGHVRANWLDKATDFRKEPVERWRALEKEVLRGSKTERGLRVACDFVVFKHTYPRLDVNVSKEINHLLKAPFCVHPKTGRVCVPFRAKDVDSFSPGEHAPVAAKLIKEIGTEGEETEKMKEAVRVFEEFVKGVELESREANRTEQLARMDARGAQELLAT